MSRCIMCGKPLTDPISQRRGMGDKCAAKHLELTAPNDEALLLGLEQLSAESNSPEIAARLQEVRAIQFRQPTDPRPIWNLINWHAGIGAPYQPIPEHLKPLATAVYQFLLHDGNLMNILRRHRIAESRLEALRLVAELGTVIPQVLAIVDVQTATEVAESDRMAG